MSTILGPTLARPLSAGASSQGRPRARARRDRCRSATSPTAARRLQRGLVELLEHRADRRGRDFSLSPSDRTGRSPRRVSGALLAICSLREVAWLEIEPTRAKKALTARRRLQRRDAGQGRRVGACAESTPATRSELRSPPCRACWSRSGSMTISDAVLATAYRRVALAELVRRTPGNLPARRRLCAATPATGGRCARPMCASAAVTCTILD